MSKKIVHITTAHPPHDMRIFRKECVSLAKTGFLVYLLVPNVPSGDQMGVKIMGVNCPVKSRLERIRKVPRVIFKIALEMNAEVYHFHDPEFLPYALKLVKKGKKVIYDVHEDLPRQILSKHYIPAPFRIVLSRVMEIYENRCIRKLDRVITATPFIRRRFELMHDGVTDIKNYPISEELPEKITWDNKKQEIAYIGGIARVRGIVELIEAMEFIPAKLHLAGKFVPASLRDRVITLPGWQKVIEHGFVDREKIMEILGRSMAGMVTLHPIINYRDALAVKMFEYMGAGIPVIASDFPLWKEIVVNGNCGLCVDPLDPKAIASAVQKILDDPDNAQQMGENGNRLVKEKYNWEQEEKELISVYDDLISNGSTR